VFASNEFRALDAESQSNRRGILEACFREPHSDTDREPIGFCPLAHVSAQKVKRLRDLKHDLPGAANNRRKYLSAMFGWAIETTPPLMKTNPAREVRRIKYATEGFHSWTPDEVRQFEERHPIGTKARLALALLLFTGVRRGDMVALGRQHVRDGWLRFIPSKTRYKRRRLSEKPLLPELARIIAASPTGDLTFLVTAYGRPFTAAGFGGWFRDRCNEAGLPHCTAHGLRKAGASLAAENAATVNQLMAIFDWDTPAQAKIYTDAADRKRMAGEAMGLLATNRIENEDCRTEKSGSVAPK
jgi:integrase